jgi:Response regulator receiver domain
MTPAERIRVFIAGDIYPKRGLVRRFLEDDGYDVVGTTASPKVMVDRIRSSEPDAVVVDGDLLEAGAAGGTLARIREAVPDAKVIVFTGGPTASGPLAPSGADGYLEKGVGLSALTALLGNMFVAEPPRIVRPAESGTLAASTGVVATASASDGPPTGVARANGNGAGAVARLVAIGSGATLVVWGLIAMLATGGPTPPPVDRTEGGTGGEVIDLTDAMVDARATLRELIGALESGDYVLASLVAEELVDVRERAKEQGFSVSDLNADITARLSAVVDLLPARVNTTLSSILGSLYPDLSNEGAQGGGDLVEGPNLTGGNGAGDTGNGGGGGGGDSGGGGGGGDNDNGGNGGGGGGGGGDDNDNGGNGGGGGGDNDNGGNGGGGGGGGGGNGNGGGGGGGDDGDNDNGGNGGGDDSGGDDDDQNGDGDEDHSGHGHDNGRGKGHEMCRGKGHPECDEVAADDHRHGNGTGPAGHGNGHTRSVVIPPERQSKLR